MSTPYWHEAYSAAARNALVVPAGHVEKPVPADKVSAVRLYSLTTIAWSEGTGGTRTVMICDSFQRACEAIERGGEYWWEHSYMFAVIESFYANIPYGGLGGVRDQYWFRYTWDKGSEPGVYPNAHYDAIEKPALFKNFGEFAVG